MNKTLNSLLATLMITGAGQAFAASSVDLTVKGLITPSACEPTLSNGSQVEIGKISAKDLNVDQPTLLPQQNLALTVTCDGATLMALEAKDNRQGSDYNNDLMSFGLGLINGDEKLGAMELSLINPLADSVAARTIGSTDGGTTWLMERNFMRNNIVSVADASVDAPIAVQLFNADMRILPTIAPASGLTLTEEVLIDGSATLTVKYL
ncbi:DUF1120 domain-containing protein [Pseudomonas sp. Marseille-Q1929]|uniref:DUF1120 domain-containing protein n=1 Tax=Pseudomonas sp. Marseille-Q1929 TaxID=2730402 RepID=UPI001A8F50A2|nr:DUF1120 domain-containing protein [Pseudomonas sp. Marseille-Q1929]MBO0491814.1 DUF1120 domain-containing protein [Pseudomonas sp. Marseille-Q1929]